MPYPCTTTQKRSGSSGWESSPGSPRWPGGPVAAVAVALEHEAALACPGQDHYSRHEFSSTRCRMGQGRRRRPKLIGQAAYRSAARARRFAASTSRSLGGAVVSRSASRCIEACATASTARLNASSLTFDGLLKPLILRTYWSAAAWTSSVVAAGSKL